jgi:L-threonylcarbamoyladenylate synthase
MTAVPEEAASMLRDGGLVAFPTETVYGLGADAFQPAAVRRIFEAKERPANNPLIVHLHARAQLLEVAASVPPVAEDLMGQFWPGPLTLIFPKHPDLPTVVTAGLETVGVRMPRLPLTRRFLAACDTPVPAPSANRSGRPSPTHWRAVAADLDGRIECILQGGRTEAGVESTVVDCTTAPPAVLRPGAISVEAVRECVGRVRVATPDDRTAPRSPGTQHRHYAPAAQVRLVDTPADAVPASTHAYIGLAPPARPEAFGRTHVAADCAAYAHDLFHYFRACDAAGMEIIFAQTVPPAGLGRALNDRLRRAAAR